MFWHQSEPKKYLQDICNLPFLTTTVRISNADSRFATSHMNPFVALEEMQLACSRSLKLSFFSTISVGALCLFRLRRHATGEPEEVLGYVALKAVRASMLDGSFEMGFSQSSSIHFFPRQQLNIPISCHPISHPSNFDIKPLNQHNSRNIWDSIISVSLSSSLGSGIVSHLYPFHDFFFPHHPTTLSALGEMRLNLPVQMRHRQLRDAAYHRNNAIHPNYFPIHPSIHPSLPPSTPPSAFITTIAPAPIRLPSARFGVTERSIPILPPVPSDGPRFCNLKYPSNVGRKSFEETGQTAPAGFQAADRGE